ncbi:DSD1 family PLP-dependent enzyme [Aquabacter cavernae]|uniref:DSD1 family PLP-dependent enzyme n=1 Tax=Aquabacter cavernae TaxID=2496029 RepID=UPI000F8D5CB1|nr:DSD1 family PLP-dependent enzyme [Aquabacter cavernae]
MPPRPPAELGAPVSEIETPALVIDLDLFERNLATMADAVGGSGVRLRPHAKAHKCPDIALRQMASGAIGVCCQKVSEAEVFVAAGIPDVLLTNEVADPRKLRRLADLSRTARIGLCVDGPAHVARLAQARAGHEGRLDILIEIDVGQGRCGMPVGPQLVDLARAIDAVPGLSFAGLQAYQGKAQHLRAPQDRRTAIGHAVERARIAKSMLEGTGIACPIVTGAGTGTFALEMTSGIYTELQPGSYALMDADYARNAFDGPVFAHALTLHATVISTAVPGQAVLDVGYKGAAVDSGLPVPVSPATEVLGMSDEHTVLRQPERAPLAVGDRVILLPGHVDPTVNLHDWFVGVRDGRVETLWPITARGAGL